MARATRPSASSSVDLLLAGPNITSLSHFVLYRSFYLHLSFKNEVAGPLGLRQFSWTCVTQRPPHHHGRPVVNLLTPMDFQSLPFEIVALILSALDIENLITMTSVSRTIRYVAADETLNPWRQPILRELHSYPKPYSSFFATLGGRGTVPRHNWVDILSIASPAFLLFECTTPYLCESEWKECFRKRYLPGWVKWKKVGSWKAVFLQLLYRIWHRTTTACTTDEAWTKCIVLNRKNTANQLDISSRNFDPMAIMHEMKLQHNIAHLPTRVRVLVEFSDVRVLAFGVLDTPRSSLLINPNASLLIHPPGAILDHPVKEILAALDTLNLDRGIPAPFPHATMSTSTYREHPYVYERLRYPQPAPSHVNYPYFTPGDGDMRWADLNLEADGHHWVGGLLITAQIVGPRTHRPAAEGPILQDTGLVDGPGRSQYTSFTWADLSVIAPWMEHTLVKRIDGLGLGN